eukprot:scaffold58689_cov36-Tisochrysis_lutea.AAC.2
MRASGSSERSVTACLSQLSNVRECASPLDRDSPSRAKKYLKLWNEAPEPTMRTPGPKGGEAKLNARIRTRLVPQGHWSGRLPSSRSGARARPMAT